VRQTLLIPKVVAPNDLNAKDLRVRPWPNQIGGVKPSLATSESLRKEVESLGGLTLFALFPVFHRSFSLIASLLQHQQ